MEFVGAVFAGVASAIAFSGWLAARELGGWRAVRLQFVVNNQIHKRRREGQERV